MCVCVLREEEKSEKNAKTPVQCRYDCYRQSIVVVRVSHLSHSRRRVADEKSLISKSKKKRIYKYTTSFRFSRMFSDGGGGGPGQ